MDLPIDHGAVALALGGQPVVGLIGHELGLDSEHVASLAVSGYTGPLRSIPLHRGLVVKFWMTCDNVVTPSRCRGPL
jgi:hypothetical protein